MKYFGIEASRLKKLGRSAGDMEIKYLMIS